MADRGQMHPNLVGSAGFEAALKPTGHEIDGLLRAAGAGRIFVSLQNPPVGHGLTAAFPDRHPVAGDLVPVDRLVDYAARSIGRTPDEGEVAALEGPPSRPWLANCAASA